MDVGAIILTFAICYIPIMVIFAMLPYIGRRTLTFGVSIPSAVHSDPQLKAMRRAFSRNVLLIGVLLSAVTVLLYVFLSMNLATGLMTGLVFVYIIAIFALYVRNFNTVKQLKAQKGWSAQARQTVVADTQFSSTRRSVSALWFLIYVVIIVGTLLVGILMYDQIPDKVAMQTDFSGNVTRITEKSFGLILFAPVLQAVIAMLFGFIYWMMQRTPPVIDPERPEISSQQNARFRYRWSAFTVFGGILMLLIFFGMQLGFAQLLTNEATIWIPMIGAGLLVVGAIVLSISTGQSGSRIRVGKAADGKIIRRDDDKYWKWGSFYVNRDDPALFVEKRFGVGFTINFGRPAAILIFVGILALITVIAILSTVLTD